MMRQFHTGLLCAAAVLGLAAAPHAQAGVGPSDVMTVFDATGAIVDQQVVFELDEDGVSIITSNVAIDPSQYGGAIVLTEPNTPGLVSDIVGICTCGVNGAEMLGFVSDSDVGPAATPASFGTPATFLLETGKPIDITQFLAPSLRSVGWTATFRSDSEVPEPAGWALMLLGFGAVGYAARSRRSAIRPA